MMDMMLYTRLTRFYHVAFGVCHNHLHYLYWLVICLGWDRTRVTSFNLSALYVDTFSFLLLKATFWIYQAMRNGRGRHTTFHKTDFLDFLSVCSLKHCKCSSGGYCPSSSLPVFNQHDKSCF